jgi:hypothetical protein
VCGSASILQDEAISRAGQEIAFVSWNTRPGQAGSGQGFANHVLSLSKDALAMTLPKILANHANVGG